MFGTVKRVDICRDLKKRAWSRSRRPTRPTPLLTDKTMFWVVKPRLFAGNVSGLDTLLSGSYVGMLPPAENGHGGAPTSSGARIRRC